MNGEFWFDGRMVDRGVHSAESAVVADGESIVQQQFKDECDINTIVRRFGLTGQMPAGRGPGVFGDFSGVHDFQSALEAIQRSEDEFMKFPPEVREQFANDVGRFLQEARFYVPEAPAAGSSSPAAGAPEASPKGAPVPPAASVSEQAGGSK